MSITGSRQYDAIIFNNPYAGRNNTGPAIAALIKAFLQSARVLLKPGGEIHINVTQSLITNYADVASILGKPNGTFGQTRYYAPYIPIYTTGEEMRYYRDDASRSAGLVNFRFR